MPDIYASLAQKKYHLKALIQKIKMSPASGEVGLISKCRLDPDTQNQRDVVRPSTLKRETNEWIAEVKRTTFGTDDYSKTREAVCG